MRRYADDGKILHIKTDAGQRLYDVGAYLEQQGITAVEGSVICYCRVSSNGRKDDLACQVAYMRENFPKAEIIKDIGSGLNFKRQGPRSILERAMRGDKLPVVVADRDRLARFGFEIVEFIVGLAGGEILVLNQDNQSPQEELVEDLLTVLTVFSARMDGLRRYIHQIKEDTDLSNA